MSDLDRQIAEFHAAGRRRKSIIFGISGALLLALGIVLLVVDRWRALPGQGHHR